MALYRWSHLEQGNCITKAMLNRIKAQLVRHKGLRLKPYHYPAGKLTTCIGRNLDDRATHDHLPEEVPLLVSFRFGFFFLMLQSTCEFLNLKTLSYSSKLCPRQLKRFFSSWNLPGLWSVATTTEVPSWIPCSGHCGSSFCLPHADKFPLTESY